ncbi:MAG TPA: hypothetical protein VIL37_01085 [Natronosporangium sp.]
MSATADTQFAEVEAARPETELEAAPQVMVEELPTFELALIQFCGDVD